MEARFSAPVQTDPGAHPASCTMGTGSFPGVKSGRGVTLTPHPRLVPWSRKGRAIPLLPLRAVRPVQSFSACTRVHFTLPFMCIYTYAICTNVHSRVHTTYVVVARQRKVAYDTQGSNIYRPIHTSPHSHYAERFHTNLK